MQRFIYGLAIGLFCWATASAQAPLLVSHLGAEFQWDLQPFTAENAPESHVLTCGSSSVTVPMPATSIPIRDVVPGPGSYTCVIYAQNTGGRQADPDVPFPLFQSGYVPGAPFQLQVLAEPEEQVMGLGIGQTALASSNGTAVTTASVTTASSGSGIVLSIDYYSAGSTFVSVSDSKGNSWVQIGSEIVDTTSTVAMRRYYAANATGGTGHTFTLTVSGSTRISSIAVTEITTTAGSGVTLDQSAQTQDNTSPFASAGITTTVADEFLLSSWTSQGDSGTYTHTAGNSFTKLANETNGSDFFPIGTGYRIVSSTGTYNGSWTTTGGSSAAVVCTDSFYEVVGGGAKKRNLAALLAQRALRV